MNLRFFRQHVQIFFYTTVTNSLCHSLIGRGPIRLDGVDRAEQHGFCVCLLFFDHSLKFFGTGLSPTASPTSFKVKGIFRWTE